MMKLIEFQVRSEPFLKQQREQLLREKICMKSEFQLAGDTYVIDHLEVGQNSVERALIPAGKHIAIPPPLGTTTPQGVWLNPAFGARIAQVIHVHAAKIEDLSEDPPAALLTTDITIFSRLWLGVSPSQSAHYGVQYDSLDIGPLLSSLPNADEIEDKLNSIVAGLLDAGTINPTYPLEPLPPPKTTEMDLSSLESLLGAAPTVSNAGVTTDEDGEALIFRMELQGPFSGSQTMWTDFYKNDVPVTLGDADWSIVVSPDILVPSTESLIMAGLFKAKEAGKFEPTGSGAAATWEPDKPGLAINFTGFVPNVCPGFIGPVYIGEIDIDVDVSVDLIFSLHPTKPNFIQLNARFFFDPDDRGVAVCGFSAGMMWPVMGVIMAANNQLTPEEYVGVVALGALTNTTGLFIGTAVFADTFTPALEVPKFIDVEDTDADVEKVQEIEVKFGSSLPVKLELTEVRGTAGGLVLSGTIADPVEVAHPPEIDVSTKVQFAWGFGNACKNPNLRASAAVGVQNKVTASERTPFAICQVRVLDDPLNQFSNYINIAGGMIYVMVPYDKIKPAYVADPYPCKLLIKSNGGARISVLDPLVPLSDQEKSVMEAELKTIQLIDCKTWAHFFWGSKFNPMWHVDPPPFAVVSSHIWTIFASGKGFQLLAESEGTILAEGTDNTAHTAHLTVETKSRAAGKELALSVNKVGV